MQLKNNLYSIVFIIIVASFFSFVLSVTSYLLKEKQKLAEEIDIKKNILKVVGILDYEGKIIKGSVLEDSKCEDINCLYEKNISTAVFDSKGNILKDADVNPLTLDLAKEQKKNHSKRRYAVFIRKSEKKIISYCLPVYGKGLWSSIYGFISLESDLNTVKGISFYKQGETPGLGAEIQSKFFQDSFKGKKIFDDREKLVSIELVKKGMGDEKKALHQVDSISGATITSKGVTSLLKNSLVMYEPYIIQLKKEKGTHGID